MYVPLEGHLGWEGRKAFALAMFLLVFFAIILNASLLETVWFTPEPTEYPASPWRFRLSYHPESPEHVAFYSMIGFGGMALAMVAIFLSTWIAIGISGITFGCVLFMPMLHERVNSEVIIFMAPSPLVFLLCIAAAWCDLPGARLIRARQIQVSPVAMFMEVAVALGILTNLFLAALLFDVRYLAGAAAALLVVRWPRYGWLGLAGAGIAASAGFVAISRDAPYLGVLDPLAWFGIPAVLLLAMYVGAVFGIGRSLAGRGDAHRTLPEERYPDRRSP